MMARFCAYVDKVFPFREPLQQLTDSRLQPFIPTSAVFLTAFMMFATHRPSLHALEPDLRLPSRFRGLVGQWVPSVDTVGRVYARLASDPLRDWLAAVAHLLKRNKALPSPSGWYFAAFDGHELFASRKRCCPQCETRTIKLKDREVTEYYHRIVACHLIGQELAVPLDAELIRPGEGEETAAKRLMERVCERYGRLFDVICGDALYLDAPFLRLCRKLHKHAIVVIKGDQRLLLQDAAQLFSQRSPEQWTWPRRTVQYWDEEGFTSCEGFDEPLRVLRSVEAKQRRERVAGQWIEKEVNSEWYWASTLSKNQLPSRIFWEAGHNRWDIENDCFNTLSTHWGLDHCFKHDPTAIINFILTLFLAYVLLQCFWRRNLKPAARFHWSTLIALADELYRSLQQPCRAPWVQILPRPP
jgi:hypothetical protein